jgi:hypothetical protein
MFKTFNRAGVVTLGIAAAIAIIPLASHAQSGDSKAAFQNFVPDGVSPDVTISSTNGSVSNNMIAWGTSAAPSSLNFAGIAFNSPVETPFKIGSLTYHNGVIGAGTGITAVDMIVDLNFTSPAPIVGNRVFSYTLNTISTSNTGNDVQNADYIDLANVSSGETIVIGATTYHLNIIGFQNFSGDSVANSDLAANGITPLARRFYVYEDSASGHTGTGTADLFGVLSESTLVADTPEPGAYALFAASGISGAGFLIRRRRSNRK